MSRGFLAAVTAACVALAPCALVDSAQAESAINNSKSNSFRMGGGGGHRHSAKAVTVKSSKSNGSERMGGGGGHRHSGRAINLNSSRSNKN
jgi:hypothetical protein